MARLPAGPQQVCFQSRLHQNGPSHIRLQLHLLGIFNLLNEELSHNSYIQVPPKQRCCNFQNLQLWFLLRFREHEKMEDSRLLIKVDAPNT